MSNKPISRMGLPQSITNIFAARNILTAKDALSMTEFELMMLLDVDLDDVRSAVAQISRVVSPPHQTALQLIKDRGRSEHSSGHLPTMLKGLDETLRGGVPFGSLTELVGPAGIGKTQFCLKLSLIAALPASVGGLNGHVVYIDTESKFSSRRLIEIGENSFPHIFLVKGMAKEIAGKIFVMHPTTADEFTESLQQIKLSLLQHEVKLVVIDSIAAITSRETETKRISCKQQSSGCPLSFLKSLAELSRVPIVVTNQVRSKRTDDSSFRYTFEGHTRNSTDNPERSDSHLVAALGIQWAHAITVRLIFEAHSGQKFIKVAKSPISPPIAFPFVVDASGVLLLSDDGIPVPGSEINAIRSQECSLLSGAKGHWSLLRLKIAMEGLSGRSTQRNSHRNTTLEENLMVNKTKMSMPNQLWGGEMVPLSTRPLLVSSSLSSGFSHRQWWN